MLLTEVDLQQKQVAQNVKPTWRRGAVDQKIGGDQGRPIWKDIQVGTLRQSEATWKSKVETKLSDKMRTGKGDI